MIEKGNSAKKDNGGQSIGRDSHAPKKSMGIEDLAYAKISENKDKGPNLSALVSEISGELGYPKDRVISRLIELREQGKIKLLESKVKSSFPAYLASSNSLWFLASIAATLISFFSIYITSGDAMYVRYAFGSLLIFFLPGFSLVQFLFSKRWESDDFVFRLALSIGLSIAIIPLITIVLNYTPFAVKLFPIAAAVSAFTILFLFLSAVSKFKRYKMMKVNWDKEE